MNMYTVVLPTLTQVPHIPIKSSANLETMAETREKNTAMLEQSMDTDS